MKLTSSLQKNIQEIKKTLTSDDIIFFDFSVNKIKSVINKGKISGDNNIGGVVGVANNTTISNTANIGIIKAELGIVGGIAGSINNAECFSAGAKYHFELQAFQMFGTVADCFIAVDQLVMIEKRLTLKRLLEAAEADFEGYSDVLAMCRKADKYGMDTPLSRKHVTRLSHTAGDLVIEKNKPYFEKERLFLVPCIQSDTWHMKYGSTYGATVDGRRAFTSFSQNSNPSNGACVNGITAMFNDMLCFPRDGLVSGALNLDIEKKDFEGENGVRMFSALLSTYLNQGGLHAQVTAVNIDDMIDAQINPHLHRELRVRVTGYSGIFVDICKKLQDDIIERMK
jgi:formate C-acetyltransferase